MKKQLKPSLGLLGVVVLVIIAVSNCAGNGTPGAITSPIAGSSAVGSPSGGASAGSPSGSPVGSPTATVSSARSTAPASRITAPPHRTTPSPHQTTAPVAAPSTPSGCHPLSNEGTCYEPGEFCRHTDHGVSGVAGDGKPIVCEDNDGWRWEPA